MPEGRICNTQPLHLQGILIRSRNIVHVAGCPPEEIIKLAFGNICFSFLLFFYSLIPPFIFKGRHCYGSEPQLEQTENNPVHPLILQIPVQTVDEMVGPAYMAIADTENDYVRVPVLVPSPRITAKTSCGEQDEELYLQDF